jgi:hypothetical protein
MLLINEEREVRNRRWARRALLLLEGIATGK